MSCVTKCARLSSWTYAQFGNARCGNYQEAWTGHETIHNDFAGTGAYDAFLRNSCESSVSHLTALAGRAS